MKTALFTSILFVFLSINLSAQTPSAETPFIEVTGTAEMEVVPNLIYLKIVLGEKNSGSKAKISIKEQEDSLKVALKKVGIDLSKLSLSDASSEYVRVTWGKDNVLTQKEYTLLLSDAQSLGKVFRELDRLKVGNAFITKVDHSEIRTFKQQVRINAIMAARQKSDYLLNAIGSQTGKPLIVREQQISMYSPKSEDLRFRGARSETSNSYIIGTKAREEFTEIQFQKIKLEYSVYVKFEIK